ncbi:MAG: hypothetical protein DMG96_05655 [Acidobacteria bacterium]|nr:MAG: hypothetical protein DMG96_05655 [Acidobacteriota bacterium]
MPGLKPRSFQASYAALKRRSSTVAQAFGSLAQVITTTGQAFGSLAQVIVTSGASICDVFCCV